jgi:CheY-like chemotaxis protein
MSEQHGGKFDLLVTDIVMPEMSGCELARRLRAGRADLKVLLVTGYTEEYVIRHGMIDAGMNLLTKPFTPDTLAEAVRRALGSPPPA